MAGKIKKLEGVAAVQSDDPGLPRDLAKWFDLPAIEQAELESFTNAGWQFIPAETKTPQQRRLYTDNAGHILIEGQFLTLKTNPGVTHNDIERLVTEHGMTIKRTLGLRQDMFQVAPDAAAERQDPLEVCAKLEQDARVKWAEPSFIEAIGQRGASGGDQG